MGWSGVDPARWVEKVKDAPRDAINRACFRVFDDVVMNTPVDTGAARGSWLCTVDQPAGDEEEGTPDKSGRVTINRIEAVLKNAKGDESVFLTSNLPYIKTLEFGGYPNPPKKGGKTKTGLPKTVDGFSAQSPHGMVGLAMQKFQTYLQKAINDLSGG